MFFLSPAKHVFLQCGGRANGGSIDRLLFGSGDDKDRRVKNTWGSKSRADWQVLLRVCARDKGVACSATWGREALSFAGLGSPADSAKRVDCRGVALLVFCSESA